MFKALLKTRMQAYFSSIFFRLNKKKAGGGKTILYALLAVYMVGCVLFWVGAMFMGISDPFIKAGLGWLVPALALLMCVGVSFIGSIFMAQKQIFEAKDNDLLLSMPIPPSYILASRVLLLLASNALFTAVILIPAFVAYCICIPQITAPMILIFVLEFIFTPFLSTALSCVCGWLVALISARMRRKNLISAVLSIGFLAAYMYVCFNLQSYATKLIAAGGAIADAIAKAIPPAYLFGTAIDHSNLLAALGFALWCAVPFAVVYALLARSFIHIATSNRGTVRVVYREKALKASSVRAALVHKELSRFFSMPMYIMNCAMGAIMAIIAVGAIVIKGGDLVEMLRSAPGISGDLLTLIACAILCFISTMNDITAPSISLEGKTLWVLKSMPVAPTDVFFAKTAASLIITLPPLALAAAAVWILLRLPLLSGLLLLITPMIFQLFASLFGLVLNLKLPRFDWTSEMAVIKQSGSVVAALFGNMGVVAAPVLVYVLAARSVPAPVYIALCAALFAVLSLLLIKYLRTTGEKIFYGF